MASVLTIFLSHQPPVALQQLLKNWWSHLEPQSLLLTYGGTEEAFHQIDFPDKIFVDDKMLRVRDQQRQYQSWRGVLRAGLQWLRNRPHFEYVHLTEYDQIPLVPDLHERLRARAETERAEIVGHHLHQIDESSHPHYLFHSKDESFHRFFEGMSAREDKRTVLSMFPTGSFWTREAFEAVASREEPMPAYVEIYLPTLAHHLGFRLRDLPDQNRFVTALGNRVNEIDSARAAGAWSLHPVKEFRSHGTDYTA